MDITPDVGIIHPHPRIKLAGIGVKKMAGMGVGEAYSPRPIVIPSIV